VRVRPRAEISFLSSGDPVPKLLLDTTVYIDDLQGKLPVHIKTALLTGGLWHSTVAECELAVLTGVLDPNHPSTANAIDRVLAVIERWSDHRIVNPDREVWREAGVLAGVLARMQQYGKAEQRRALNDALIFLSAAKAGLTVLTRNVSDFDLLMQLAPHGQALFYDVA
jgi:predicted nucleic acid-binding protein